MEAATTDSGVDTDRATYDSGPGAGNDNFLNSGGGDGYGVATGQNYHGVLIDSSCRQNDNSAAGD